MTKKDESEDDLYSTEVARAKPVTIVTRHGQTGTDATACVKNGDLSSSTYEQVSDGMSLTAITTHTQSKSTMVDEIPNAIDLGTDHLVVMQDNCTSFSPPKKISLADYRKRRSEVEKHVSHVVYEQELDTRKYHASQSLLKDKNTLPQAITYLGLTGSKSTKVGDNEKIEPWMNPKKSCSRKNSSLKVITLKMNPNEDEVDPEEIKSIVPIEHITTHSASDIAGQYIEKVVIKNSDCIFNDKKLTHSDSVPGKKEENSSSIGTSDFSMTCTALHLKELSMHNDFINVTSTAESCMIQDKLLNREGDTMIGHSSVPKPSADQGEVCKGILNVNIETVSKTSDSKSNREGMNHLIREAIVPTKRHREAEKVLIQNKHVKGKDTHDKDKDIHMKEKPIICHVESKDNEGHTNTSLEPCEGDEKVSNARKGDNVPFLKSQRGYSQSIPLMTSCNLFTSTNVTASLSYFSKNKDSTNWEKQNVSSPHTPVQPANVLPRVPSYPRSFQAIQNILFSCNESHNPNYHSSQNWGSDQHISDHKKYTQREKCIQNQLNHLPILGDMQNEGAFSWFKQSMQIPEKDAASSTQQTYADNGVQASPIKVSCEVQARSIFKLSAYTPQAEICNIHSNESVMSNEAPNMSTRHEQDVTQNISSNEAICLCTSDSYWHATSEDGFQLPCDAEHFNFLNEQRWTTNEDSSVLQKVHFQTLLPQSNLPKMTSAVISSNDHSALLGVKHPSPDLMNIGKISSKYIPSSPINETKSLQTDLMTPIPVSITRKRSNTSKSDSGGHDKEELPEAKKICKSSPSSISDSVKDDKLDNDKSFHSYDEDIFPEDTRGSIKVTPTADVLNSEVFIPQIPPTISTSATSEGRHTKCNDIVAFPKVTRGSGNVTPLAVVLNSEILPPPNPFLHVSSNCKGRYTKCTNNVAFPEVTRGSRNVAPTSIISSSEILSPTTPHLPISFPHVTKSSSGIMSTTISTGNRKVGCDEEVCPSHKYFYERGTGDLMNKSVLASRARGHFSEKSEDYTEQNQAQLKQHDDMKNTYSEYYPFNSLMRKPCFVSPQQNSSQHHSSDFNRQTSDDILPQFQGTLEQCNSYYNEKDDLTSSDSN